MPDLTASPVVTPETPDAQPTETGGQESTALNPTAEQLAAMSADDVAQLIKRQATHGMGPTDEGDVIIDTAAPTPTPVPTQVEPPETPQGPTVVELQTQIEQLTHDMKKQQVTVDRQGAELGEYRTGTRKAEEPPTPPPDLSFDITGDPVELLSDPQKFSQAIGGAIKQYVDGRVDSRVGPMETNNKALVGLMTFMTQNPEDWSTKLQAINTLSETDPKVQQLYAIDPEAALTYATAVLQAANSGQEAKAKEAAEGAEVRNVAKKAAVIAGVSAPIPPTPSKDYRDMTADELQALLPMSETDPVRGPYDQG